MEFGHPGHRVEQHVGALEGRELAEIAKASAAAAGRQLPWGSGIGEVQTVLDDAESIGIETPLREAVDEKFARRNKVIGNVEH